MANIKEYGHIDGMTITKEIHSDLCDILKEYDINNEKVSKEELYNMLESIYQEWEYILTNT